MSTPILRLRPDCLKSPIKNDLLLIQAHMLWPDDERARDNAKAAGAVEIAQPRIDHMSRAELVEYSKFAAKSPNLSSTQQDIAERWHDGFLAGLILHQAVAFHARGEKFTLRQIRKEACDRHKSYGKKKGLHRGGQIEPKTIENNIWPRFKPVAALWAAYVGGDDVDFPCRPSELGIFLAQTNYYRHEGERARGYKSNSPVLLRGESVLFPHVAGIPAIAMTFEPARSPMRA